MDMKEKKMCIVNNWQEVPVTGMMYIPYGLCCTDEVL